MTPKQKAKELRDSMYAIMSNGMELRPPKDDTVSYYLARHYRKASKQCALKEVVEILEAIDWHEFETPNKDIEYWQQVKSEIEKL